ncbi:MAG: dienelactone hydrolase [Pseudomonadota bacterium]
MRFSNTEAGKIETGPRQLTVRVWYPMDLDGLERDKKMPPYRHTIRLFDGTQVEVETPALAQPDGEIDPGVTDSFPLVLLSHGYGGWHTVMTYLTENLASKGYVTAAIDHSDLSPPGARAPALDFADTFINRSRDQQKVLAALLGSGGAKDFQRLINPEQVAVVGYSMGGFGALATGGASYAPNSNAANLLGLPQEVREALATAVDEPVASAVKALVLLAPWGAQPTYRAWDEASLGNVNIPVLLLAGRHDDVSDYEAGVRWLFDTLSGTDRYLLTYESARHNIANNPVLEFAPALRDAYVRQEYFAEPVWRTERLNAINLHFVTAFLNLTLKGNGEMLPYLQLPVEASADGDWPLPFGQSGGDAHAGEQQTQFWRGFRRRWALGMTMEYRSAAKTD